MNDEDIHAALRDLENSVDCITVRLPTLRERAAIAAMQGIASNLYLTDRLGKAGVDDKIFPSLLAKVAVEYADALLAELAKKVSV